MTQDGSNPGASPAGSGRPDDPPFQGYAPLGPEGSARAPGGAGHTVIADAVVAKIAGIAARDVDGVYDLGGGTARAMGQLRGRLRGGTANLAQGITVEVGEEQAAIDVDVVVDYGVAIAEVTARIRLDVISAVERMTGLQVTEVNVAVHDVHRTGEDDGRVDS